MYSPGRSLCSSPGEIFSSALRDTLSPSVHHFNLGILPATSGFSVSHWRGFTAKHTLHAEDYYFKMRRPPFKLKKKKWWAVGILSKSKQRIIDRISPKWLGCIRPALVWFSFSSSQMDLQHLGKWTRQISLQGKPICPCTWLNIQAFAHPLISARHILR